MKVISEMKGTIDDGRELQFEAMMEQLASMQAKYKGVRGELLAKVREELMRLKPVRSAPATPPPPPEKVLPSCRVCGRTMKRNGPEGSLVCEKGHIRLLAS